MTEKRSITARLNPTRKAKMEALASVYYRGAQADVIRRWIDEQFAAVFGDLDPTALLDGRVDETEARQLMKDVETDADERLDDAGIDDDLRMDDDDEVAAVAQDGGTLTHQPERFNTMLGPQELQQSGPALEWEELREIVSDDGHWSEQLEIHPDRVQPGTLKSNHKVTSRILAAMVRSKADGGIVPGPILENTIEENVAHLHDRVDEEEGMRYLKNTYEPLVRRHLWDTPNPDSTAMWSRRSQRINAIETSIESPWDNLDTDLTTESLFDRDRWMDVFGKHRFDEGEWHSDLADWLRCVAELQNIATDLRDDDSISKDEIAVDVSGDYADVVHWLLSMVGDLRDRFVEAVPEKHREDVLNHRCSDTVEELIRDRLE